jgi:ATP-binding cassette subfamily B protein
MITKHPFFRLLDYCHAYKSQIYLATLYSFLNKLFDILPEVLIGVAVNIIVKQQNSILAHFGIINVKLQILILGLVTGGIWILESTFQYLYSIKWSVLAQYLQHDLRIDCYTHMQNLELEFFENKATGNLMAMLNDDINQLERFLNDGFNQIIQIISSTILISSIFFIISVKVALLSFIPIPLILIGIAYFKNRLAPRYIEVRNTSGVLNSKLNNNISGITTIKAFNTQNYEINNITQLSNDYIYANKNAITMSALVTPVIRMAVMCGFLMALIYGGFLTIDNKIEIASYSILIFLSQRLLWPLTYLGQVTDMYQRTMASIKRLDSILNTNPKIINGSSNIEVPLQGKIEFRHVTFNYLNRNTLFTNLSFLIKPNHTVAFVGSTGSGKSSIIKLLMRFYDITAGNILIDDQDIKTLNINSLLEHIGIVNQDPLLIDGTIYENICYGSFNKSISEVEAIAKLTAADDFINQLPLKYGTIIGERGQKLSGGQKQRIAMTRALIKNPKILILDEATSALDNKTESIIQDRMQELTKNRTTIIIAHRLSTIVNADYIYVLDHGHIIEEGTHQDLLNYNAYYKNLWELQSRGTTCE